MQTDASRNEIVSVAVFFITMILLAVASLYVTGGLEGVFAKKDRIYVAFNESVTGLSEGSPVSISGVNVGRVVSINPMTDAGARNLVREATVIRHEPKRRRGTSTGEILPGNRYLETNDPLVLTEVRVRKNAIPLNRKTRVSLITTNFTASQAVRFSAGAEGTPPPLREGAVVVDADRSPLSTLRDRFLEEDRGALRRKNIERINLLLKNLNTVSEQLSNITGEANQNNLRRMIENHRNVASTLDRWLNGESHCPGSERVRVSKVEENGTVRYRYKCPESGTVRTKDHPPAPGRLQATVQKLDRLLVRLNSLVSPEGKKKNSIPALVRRVNDLSEKVGGTASTIRGFVQENRPRMGRLLEKVNRLSDELSGVASQLNRDPSSAVFGRRGSEIRAPYGD